MKDSLVFICLNCNIFKVNIRTFNSLAIKIILHENCPSLPFNPKKNNENFLIFNTVWDLVGESFYVF